MKNLKKGKKFISTDFEKNTLVKWVFECCLISLEFDQGL